MKRVPQIKSVMTPFPYSVDRDAPLHEARAFMMQEGIRHLPVTKDGVLVGMITDRDIKLVLGPDFDYPTEEELSVNDVMVEHAYTVDLHERLDNVLDYMAEHHVGSAMVTRNGKLAGIFTATDACRAFSAHLREQFAPPDGDEAA